MATQSKGNTAETDKVTYFQDGNGGITSLVELRLERSATHLTGMYKHDGSEFHGHELPKGSYVSNLGALKPISMDELDRLTAPDKSAAIKPIGKGEGVGEAKRDGIEDLGSIGSDTVVRDEQLVGAGAPSS